MSKWKSLVGFRKYKIRLTMEVVMAALATAQTKATNPKPQPDQLADR